MDEEKKLRPGTGSFDVFELIQSDVNRWVRAMKCNSIVDIIYVHP